MSDPTNARKSQHIRVLLADRDTDRHKYHFDDIRLKHRALPEVNLKDVDPSVLFMGKKLSFPLLISSMTGGDEKVLRTINRNLALAAEQAGVALALGSQRVMFSHPKARASFELRRHAPSILLFSNLGAIQLNYGLTAAQCREAVNVAGADALYLHLNPLQEAVQPEGDTDFAGLAGKIGRVIKQIPVPVVIKEVGAGISPEDARLLARQGVKFLDVAGSGGTSWSRVEHHRRPGEGSDDVGLVFQDWGIPTPTALRALRPLRKKVTLIASGGLRSGIDMVKAMILGASLCGLANPFLKPAMESPEKVLAVIERLRREFTTAMFLVGVPSIGKLIGNDSLTLENR